MGYGDMNAEDYKARVRASLGAYSARLVSEKPQDKRWAERQHQAAARDMKRLSGQRRAKSEYPTEAHEQRELCKWLKKKGLLYAANQEGMYHGDTVAGANAKRAGLKKGRPDIEIFTPPPKHPTARGVAIELKSTRPDAKATPEQILWLEKLSQAGWVTCICYGAEDATKWLESLGW